MLQVLLEITLIWSQDTPINCHRFLSCNNWAKSAIKATQLVNNHQINIKHNKSI